MDWEIRRVKFASEKLENDYKRLAVSKNPEDKKQYSVLRKIRKKVWNKYNTGKKIPKDTENFCIFIALTESVGSLL